MKFSIRTILALTFLVALLLLAMNSVRDVKLAEANMTALHMQVQRQKEILGTQHPEVHQAILDTIQSTATLERTRLQAIESFDAMAKRYSSVEPRGPDTLSIRALPRLPSDPERAAVVYRVIVPSTRTIWFKMGVWNRQPNNPMFSVKYLDNKAAFLYDTRLKRSGPYQIELPPGTHDLRFEVQPVVDDVLPIILKLDDRALVRISHQTTGATARVDHRMKWKSQRDFGPDDGGSWLGDIDVGKLSKRGSYRDEYRITLWLSVASSDFEEFPGE